MGKYFLGSVGRAEAFRMNNGNLELAFVSKTLTDSGLTISTTKDDIRAGEGAPVQFSFYHDANVEINLTDVVWKKEYLEAQLGARFNQDGQGVDYQSKDYTSDETTGEVEITDATPLPLPVACADGDQYVVWYSQAGKDEWYMAEDYNPSTKTFTARDGNNNPILKKPICVRYLAADQRAKVAEITATIIPSELFLIITTPIYSGDACSASQGKNAGHITFEVPRFQLNGSQEFSMNMSSNQTMSLNGIALAAPSEDCEATAGKLLTIIEVITNEDWYTGVVELIADLEAAKPGEKPVIYALRRNGEIFRCDNSKLKCKIGSATTWSDLPATYTASTTYHINILDASGNPVLTGNDEDVTVSAS